MSVVTPAQLAKYMKARSNVIVMAGYQCDEMELDGRKLSDYAAEVALKLNAPVAATGNAVVALKAKGAKAIKKVAVELVEMLRYAEWRDPIMSHRPEAVVFIGYPKGIATSLVVAARDVDTMVLGADDVSEATYSLGDASLKKYQQNLDRLLKALAA